MKLFMCGGKYCSTSAKRSEAWKLQYFPPHFFALNCTFFHILAHYTIDYVTKMSRFTINLEQTWFEVREVQGSVLEDEPRFRMFEVRNFKVHSNMYHYGKFTHLLLFCALKTFGLVWGLVFFGRFGGSKFSFRGQTYVRNVWGCLVFSGSFEV